MKRALAWLFIVMLVALAAFGGWLYFGLGRPYKGYTGEEQFVEIPQGAGTGSIGTRLVQAGVIRDTLSFRFELARTGTGRRLQAGEYRFDRPMTVRDVVAKIARGDVYLRPITFREGLTVRQMSELYESKGFGPAAEFVAAASDPAPIQRLDPEARTLEGYLFPDTYSLPRATTAAAAHPAHGGRIREDADAGAPRAGGGARPERPRARDARVDRREGNRQPRRAAARRGRVLEPDENRDAAAGRSDRHLRARARRARTTAISRATICSSTHRTTPIGTRDCLRDRSPPPAARPSKPRRIPRTCRTCTSSAATTVPTPSPPRSTSTTATSSSSRGTCNRTQ